MKKLLILSFCCMCVLFVKGQGITFFQGTFDAALQKAKSEKKILFVDFMAAWCGPCKVLASDVFTDKGLGEYFNKNFVSLKVDVDKEKALAARYKVEAMPTMLFLGADGKQLKSVEGLVTIEYLLKSGKEVTGEAPSFDALWGQYEKGHKDVQLMQQLLQDIPYSMDGKDMAVWEKRAMDLYHEYVKTKTLEKMINADDFKIITTYSVPDKNDKAMQFVSKNLAQYLKIVSLETVSQAFITYTGGLLDQLAKAGDLDYKKVLEVALTEQKEVFNTLSLGTWSVREFMTNRADGYYMLYGKKDQQGFIKLRKEYLEKMKGRIGRADYKAFVDDMFAATEMQLTKESGAQCIAWAQAMLNAEGEPGEGEQMDTHLLTGDCYVAMGEKGKAGESYKKAYSIIEPFDEPGIKQYIQEKIDSVKAK